MQNLCHNKLKIDSLVNELFFLEPCSLSRFNHTAKYCIPGNPKTLRTPTVPEFTVQSMET